MSLSGKVLGFIPSTTKQGQERSVGRTLKMRLQCYKAVSTLKQGLFQSHKAVSHSRDKGRKHFPQTEARNTP